MALNEEIEVINSGREVPRAIIVRLIIPGGTLQYSAIITP